jgi:hypothetical protein
MPSKTQNYENESLRRIELKIQGVGEIPSFKNSKMIARIKGRPALITDPRKQNVMEAIIRSIESQLPSSLPTFVTVTGTELTLRSKIVSFMPLDDSLKWIPEHSVRIRRVAKGREGAEITIERL